MGAIAILGVVGTAAALVMFNLLIQRTSAIFAASVTYLIPVFCFVLGGDIRREHHRYTRCLGVCCF